MTETVTEPDVGGGPQPVDWNLAARVGVQLAGRDRLEHSYLYQALVGDFRDVTAEAEVLVADFTGLHAPGSARAEVLDRGGWVRANVASTRRLLAPLTDQLGARLAASPLAPVGRAVAGAELGFVLGMVAQRVLGQYDLLVLEEADTGPDAVYYVGSNVMALEQKFAFSPREFRRWIAIHEVTHRAQFTGVPWMRGYFLGLVEESLALVDPDPRRWFGVVGRIADDLRRGRNPLDGSGLIGLIASPEQRTVLDRIQALMSLLEGHGNAVMNRLGRDHVEGHERMARTLEARRKSVGVQALVSKLLGLEMKLRQYEVGERFVDAVERTAGLPALDRAWIAPEHLPTLTELEDAPAWLARVGA